MHAVSCLAAEPASIIYIATGLAGICLTRLRLRRQPVRSSILMLFCHRSAKNTVAEVNLFEA